MKFKSWPYWIRGGAIGSIVIFIFTVFFDMCLRTANPSSYGAECVIIGFPAIPGILSAYKLGEIFISTTFFEFSLFDSTVGVALLIITQIIFGFLIGSFIGGTYGQIKRALRKEMAYQKRKAPNG